jgi:hypothetical protein
MAFNRGCSTENPAAETAASTPLGHKADTTGGQRSEVGGQWSVVSGRMSEIRSSNESKFSVMVLRSESAALQRSPADYAERYD